jgi:hypothetical protein
MRTTIAAALVLVPLALTGCGSSADEAPATGTSDCQQGVRFDGATYTEVGYLQKADGRAGDAVLGECDDQGADAAGVTFPEGAETVEVVALPGAEPAQAVGLRTPDGVQVFVADGLDAAARSQVVSALGLEE